MLLASHYHLLTQQEWDLATAESFQITMPITINWDYMDAEMLSKAWSTCVPVSVPEPVPVPVPVPLSAGMHNCLAMGMQGKRA